MAKIEPFDADLDILQKLDDVPNLTAKAMQNEFDKSGNIIKNFLNTVIIPAINNIIAVTGETDKTLSIDGAPADALTVGERIGQIVTMISDGLHLKLDKAGGTMTGKLTVLNPTESGDAANKGYVDTARKFFHNVSVPVSAFVGDETYEDYGYKADIALSGVTASMIPEVVFPVSDLGVAPVCESYDGGVRIWADDVPEEAITIPTIILWRGDSV